MPHDRMDIGWWIKSTDEELYGPVSRATILRYLDQAVITPDTLVRHSVAVEFHPVGDQSAFRDGPARATRPDGRDRIAEVWPRKRKERLALAEGAMRCMRHNRPATQICMCCLGPYCEKCRTNKKKPFYNCRQCQASLYYGRGGAFFFDSAISWVAQVALAAGIARVGGIAGPLMEIVALGAPTLAFIFRDPLSRGAGPGKRIFGLKAVREANPTEPLTYGQAFIRSIPLLIPFVNLLDLSVPYRDPLCRRWGDRWAKTRVVYTARRLEKIRAKATRRIERKVGDCLPLDALPQEILVRLAG